MQKNKLVEKDDFTLKNKENLIELEEVLDDLITHLEKNIREFKIIYQNLPIKFYNKIDNLRSTSLERKSEDFKRIAYKAKRVSKEFHNNFK